MTIQEPEVEIREYKVGIAQWDVAVSPHKLITLGLGSCVGIALYDPFAKIGGLGHIMLPDSTQFTRNDNKGKFPDTAIPLILEKMVREGARERAVRAKIAGGAQMFSTADKKYMGSIGSRNVEKTIEVLEGMGIKITAKEVGGKNGRTMIFNTLDGSVLLRVLGKEVKML
ncbi:MAG: chemotaxis protein CheD [Clostridia bacterium]|nr:chemotaxis protein CheD [Clostridia bacterium]